MFVLVSFDYKGINEASTEYLSAKVLRLGIVYTSG